MNQTDYKETEQSGFKNPKKRIISSFEETDSLSTRFYIFNGRN